VRRVEPFPVSGAGDELTQLVPETLSHFTPLPAIGGQIQAKWAPRGTAIPMQTRHVQEELTRLGRA
jgi:hypothetical protein